MNCKASYIDHVDDRQDDTPDAAAGSVEEVAELKVGMKRNWTRADIVFALVLTAGAWFLTDAIRSGEFYFRTVIIQEPQSPAIFWFLAVCFLILLIGTAILLFFCDLDKFFGDDNNKKE